MTATERARELLDIAAAAADSKQAVDLVALDVSGPLPLTDVFLIASGRNERNVIAIAGEIEDKLIGLPVVRNSRVVAMSRREVQLSLDFVGSTSQLQTALNQQNLNLTRMGELWFIQPTGSDRLQGLSIGG